MVSNTSDTVYGENHWKVLISKMKKIKDHPPSNVPWFLKSQRCKTGFPGGSVVKSLPAKQETRVWSLGREDPPEKEWQPTLVFLPGESHGRRSLVGYSPWGHKESDTTEWLNWTEKVSGSTKWYQEKHLNQEINILNCTSNNWLLVPQSDFPGGSDGKASACNAGDLGSIPGLGRSPQEGKGNPLQHSCLGNPTDGGA